MYIKIETTRLDYIRNNQNVIRADLYQGIIYSKSTGETQSKNIGHHIILPASFIEGPHDMRRRCLDAMALVQKFGKPNIFLTITCKRSWPEIKSELRSFEQAHNRADVLSRIFRAKLIELKKDVIQKRLCGPIIAFFYVIEFHKRG